MHFMQTVFIIYISNGIALSLPPLFFFFRSCAFSLLLGNKSLLKHANTLTWPGKALLKTQNNAIKINYQHDTCHVIHFFPIFSLFFLLLYSVLTLQFMATGIAIAFLTIIYFFSLVERYVFMPFHCCVSFFSVSVSIYKWCSFQQTCDNWQGLRYAASMMMMISLFYLLN